MSRARLIKRKEVLEREQEQVEHPPDSAPPTIGTTMETVLEWLKDRQPAQRQNPREKFAQLFSNAVK